jgi:ketosteroid isomerase-like protein
MRRTTVLAGIGLAMASVLPLALTADATGNESMDIHKRLEIERECERHVYTFLRLFEGEHAKTADLFTKDASVPFPSGKPTVGREAIREFFSTIDARNVELNVLMANNLVITVVDENSATGFCYVTHYQHVYADSKREGQAVLRAPNTVTSWYWEFKRVQGEWKIAKLDVDLVLLNERFIDASSE